MAQRTSLARNSLFYNKINAVHTAVVKVGSRTILPHTSGGNARIKKLVSDISQLCTHVQRVVLVSSGAISCGMHYLELKRRPATIPMRQACAGIGQIKLMQKYDALFRKHDRYVGQVLVTWNDFRHKERYLNLRNTLFQLMEYRAIPIVNENDSIGVEEIRFGENDKLGAQIAMMVNADVYIILTDVDGLFDRNPHTHDNARHISDVSHISRDMYDCAGYQRNELSVGGMKTKIEAAEMVTKAGIYAIIGNGYSRGLLESITDPEAATLFHPSQKKMKSRERWLAFSGKIQGTLWIDAGAADALRHRGKSLLPAGISKTEGTYKPGDAVEVRCTKTGERIARGFTNYGNEDVDRIKGEKSAAVASILGEKTFNVVVHRNNMVLVC